MFSSRTTARNPPFVLACRMSLQGELVDQQFFLVLFPVMIQLHHTLPHAESPCGVPIDFSLV